MNGGNEIDVLKESIKQGQVILFVGAGVSSSIGIPTWEMLIDKIGQDLGYDKEVFKILGRNNYLALAEYYKIETGSIGPLRSWMDVEWHKNLSKVKDSKIHKSIVNLSFSVIYTTNYDRMLEESFKIFCKNRDVVKISDVSDLKKVKSNDVQIIKFHGDFDRDDSIVLAESDYYKRLSFETPLDIKLRADLLGKTVLFIGYSFSDVNIRYMLFKLSELWNSSLKPSEKPKSYIFNNSINHVQQQIFSSWGVTVLSNDLDDQTEALEKFLSDLEELK